MSAAPNLITAREYRARGLSVLPLEAQVKRPLIGRSWKQNQTRPMTDAELERIYAEDPARNIGIIGGAISGNLVVIDVDDVSKFRLSGAEKKLQNIITSTWVTRTPRGKGLHIYLRTPEGAVRTGPGKGISGRKLNYGLEFKAEGGYVAAPNSIFGGSGQYEFLSFPDKILEVELSDLAFLDPELAPEQSLRPYGIPFKFWDMLKAGNYQKYGFSKSGNGRSISEAEFQLVCYLVNLSWTMDEVYELFRIHANDSSHFHSQPNWSMSYLRTTYENAAEHVRKNKSQHKRRIELAFERVNAIDSGRTTLTDRDVLRALLRISLRTNKPEIGASVREVAELAQVHWFTAMKALRRLEEGRCIKQTEKPQHWEASVYSLTPFLFKVRHEARRVSSHDHSCGNPVQECSQDETFWHRGLNKTGKEVFQAILRNPGIRPGQVVEKVRCGRATVFRRLAQMETLGMIEKRDGGFHALNYNKGLVAERLGTAGLAEEQRRRHMEDRRAHRYNLKHGYTKKPPLCDEHGEVIG